MCGPAGLLPVEYSEDGVNGQGQNEIAPRTATRYVAPVMAWNLCGWMAYSNKGEQAGDWLAITCHLSEALKQFELDTGNASDFPALTMWRVIDCRGACSPIAGRTGSGTHRMRLLIHATSTGGLLRDGTMQMIPRTGRSRGEKTR